MAQPVKRARTTKRTRRPKQSGVKTKVVKEPPEAPEADPFAEFDHTWEPVRKRQSEPPTD